MTAFTSIDWFTITGRGRVAVVACDSQRPRDNPGLVGEEVTIDGVRYRCIGVERSMVNTPIRAGELIGLLVESVRR